jgi:hypothetical protein
MGEQFCRFATIFLLAGILVALLLKPAHETQQSSSVVEQQNAGFVVAPVAGISVILDSQTGRTYRIGDGKPLNSTDLRSQGAK